MTRLSATPGIGAVAIMGRLPLATFSGSTSYQVNDHRRPTGKEPTADYVAVGPGFFDVMRIAVLSGRPITERDRVDTPRAVLVNREFARREWPNANAIGKSLEVYTDDGKMREIVGVVADVNLRGLDEPPNPTIYVPLAQNPFPQHLRSASFLARFDGDGRAGAAAARETLARFDPEQSVTPFRPMEEVVSESLSSRRLNLGLTLLFGALAATLAGVGIFAVMAHSVGERRMEIGIRIALGANARTIVRMILTDGARLAGAGIVLGLLAAVPLTRVLSSLLFGVGPRDPGVLSEVSLAVLAISLAAVWIPARRAALVDPMRALQSS
jgi:predicted permease